MIVEILKYYWTCLAINCDYSLCCCSLVVPTQSSDDRNRRQWVPTEPSKLKHGVPFGDVSQHYHRTVNCGRLTERQLCFRRCGQRPTKGRSLKSQHHCNARRETTKNIKKFVFREASCVVTSRHAIKQLSRNSKYSFVVEILKTFIVNVLYCILEKTKQQQMSGFLQSSRISVRIKLTKAVVLCHDCLKVIAPLPCHRKSGFLGEVELIKLVMDLFLFFALFLPLLFFS